MRGCRQQVGQRQVDEDVVKILDPGQNSVDPDLAAQSRLDHWNGGLGSPLQVWNKLQEVCNHLLPSSTCKDKVDSVQQRSGRGSV